MDLMSLLRDKQENLRGNFPTFPKVTVPPEINSTCEIIEVASNIVAFAQPTNKDESVWGKNCWISHANYASASAEWIKPLFSGLAAKQSQEGVRDFFVEVLASQQNEIQMWFELGFGLQHALAIKSTPVQSEIRSNFSIRRAEVKDLGQMAILEQELALHQMGSPVFSRVEPEPLEVIMHDWKQEIDNPDYSVFVAENKGEVIALSYGCSTEKSSAHSGLLRPDNSATLAFCVVNPHFRGVGIGLDLAGAVLLDLQKKGFQNFVTDWRITNQLSSRAWPKIGFTPTIFRLHRSI